MLHRADRQPGMAGAPRALILIPETVNYFYNTSGRRLAEALGESGCTVEVGSLKGPIDGEWDLCLLSNLSEVLHAFGDEGAGLARVRELGKRCGAVAVLGMESAATPWFRRLLDLGAAADIPTILDLGLWDQSPLLDAEGAKRYRFLRDGLTSSESRALDEVLEAEDDRPIPWCFVGHLTHQRAAMVDFLIREVDPSGFFYLAPLGPTTETATPHLNPNQFNAVLGRSCYHVWCSHHHAFYVELERFRLSMLAGCVPIKVLMPGQEPPPDAPLRYLMVSRDDLPALVRSTGDRWLHRRLCNDYRSESLAESLAKTLGEAGLLRLEVAEGVTSAPLRAKSA